MSDLPADPVASRTSRPPFDADRLLLQTSHRLSAVALFALLGTVASVYLGRDIQGVVTAAALVSLLALCAALLALSDRPRLGLAIVVFAIGLGCTIPLLIDLRYGSAAAVACIALLACVALFVWTAEPGARPPFGEAAGLLLFNLVLATVAFTLVLHDGSDVICENVRTFLTPPRALPPQ